MPQVDGSDVLQGQVLAVEVASLTDGVAAFKARLSEVRSHWHCHVAAAESPVLLRCPSLQQG